jgi:exodeoxyribonuclease VII large subunit
LRRIQHNRFNNAQQTLDYLQRRLIHPAQQLQRQAQQLEQLQQRMRRAFKHRAQQQDGQWQNLAQRLNASRRRFLQPNQTLDHLAQRLSLAVAQQHRQQDTRLAHAAQQLNLLNPQQVLGRGYSLVRDTSGRVVSDGGRVVKGETLHITFATGGAEVEVQQPLIK